MAIIIRGKTHCPLCYKVINEPDEIVGTSHFIADKSDSLWMYSDTAFHKVCFLAWDKREEFISRYNQISKNLVFGNGKYHHMDSTGKIVSLKAHDVYQE